MSADVLSQDSRVHIEKAGGRVQRRTCHHVQIDGSWWRLTSVLAPSRGLFQIFASFCGQCEWRLRLSGVWGSKLPPGPPTQQRKFVSAPVQVTSTAPLQRNIEISNKFRKKLLARSAFPQPCTDAQINFPRTSFVRPKAQFASDFSIFLWSLRVI